MVVLDALLKSAAACQTVGKIVCPATLMSQLHTTLASVHRNLGTFEATLATSSSGTGSHDRNP
jgi:ABC-type molybdate transport system permease subunit